MVKRRQKIILIGGGGHCKVIIDAIRKNDQFEIAGIIDNNLRIHNKILGVSVLGNDEILDELYERGLRNAFIAVGSLGDCSIRRSIFQNLKRIGFILPVIIHPSSVIGVEFDIDEGAFIAAGVMIGPCVKVGRNAIINTGSSIDHDCQIGDFVHIAPGVTLSGGVRVGESTHIGIGTNVVQGVNIGKNCMVKAATLVFQDLDDGTIRHRDSVNSAGGLKSRES